MEFNEFNFHPKIAAGITKAGFETPTPIQEQAIPPILKKRDVMGLAQTGTGKTAAFVLPILERLMNGPRGIIRGLIIAPTRELAEQITDTIRTLGRQTGLRSMSIYGGVGITPQIKKLRDGVDIVVACPGRLLDHIYKRMIDLSNLEMLVLDEADRMFDMGFLNDIKKIISHTPKERQTMLFSATMPDDIKRLCSVVLKDPLTVKVNHTAPANSVAHALYPVAQHLKTELLREILRSTDTESILIFTRTKHRAKRLGEQIIKDGYRAASLQGNLSQNRRTEVLNGFRKGNYQILVATDIAARGIDVSSISHVINYDIPDTTDAYTHRIGRTGRAAKTGDAFTFITGADEPLVRSIEKVLGAKVKRCMVEGFDYKKPGPATSSDAEKKSRGRHSLYAAKKGFSGKSPSAAYRGSASKPASVGAKRQSNYRKLINSQRPA